MEIEEKINKLFFDMMNQLTGKYSSFLERADISIEVNDAIEWLKKVQHPDGYWGYRSIADTSLVLYALGKHHMVIDKWSIPSDTQKDLSYEGGVSKAIKWLRKKCNPDCEGNLWDTSITLRALNSLGMHDEWSNKMSEWIYNQLKKYSSGEKDFKPHHIAQALIALAEYENEYIDEIIHSLSKFLENLYTIINLYADHPESIDGYVFGQVIEALSFFSTLSENCRPLSNHIADLLYTRLTQIANTGLSEASFEETIIGLIGLFKSNYIDISTNDNNVDFKKLKISNTNNNNIKVVHKLIAEILETPTRRKKDGSWYHNAKLTAWALILFSIPPRARIIKITIGKLEDIIQTYENMTINLVTELKKDFSRTIEELRKGYLWLTLSIITWTSTVFITVKQLFPSPSVNDLVVNTLLVALGIESLRKTYTILVKSKKYKTPKST